MPISRRTLALLAYAIDDRFTRAAMDGLMFEYGIEESDPGGSCQEACDCGHATVEAQRDEKGLLEAIKEIAPRLELTLQNPVHARLIESLRIDGFEVSAGGLVPTTPAPAAIGEQISHEQELMNK